jgi:hypothetical protein
MSRFNISVTYCVLLALAPVAALAVPPMPDSVGGQPTRAPAVVVPGVSCTATGTWTDQFTSGDGTWTKTAKHKCNVPGNWTDAYGYTWRLKKSGQGQVTGKVNYNGAAECKHQVWPVTGTYKKLNFSVTATNPGGPDDDCSSFFSYMMTIE